MAIRKMLLLFLFVVSAVLTACEKRCADADCISGPPTVDNNTITLRFPKANINGGFSEAELRQVSISDGTESWSLDPDVFTGVAPDYWEFEIGHGIYYPKDQLKTVTIENGNTGTTHVISDIDFNTSEDDCCIEHYSVKSFKYNNMSKQQSEPLVILNN